MISLSRCVLNPGRGVARISQRMLRTSTHPTWLSTRRTDTNSSWLPNHEAWKPSTSEEDINTILNGVFHHSVYHPCAGQEIRCVHGFSASTTHPTIIVDPVVGVHEEISVMNRNARRPKRANHGARPCSRSSRRFKKEKIGKRSRG